jgi:citrate synthase
MFISTIAALSTFYPDSRNILSRQSRNLQVLRLIGKVPTIAAYAYRHGLGLPYVDPDDRLSYGRNFLNMMWKRTDPEYNPDPVLARALEVLFILHADHEQNCSTNTMRCVGSAHADPYVAVAAAAAALSGPLHGGANEEVLKMLDEIGSADRIPQYIDKVKTGQVKLMGFGHRVYKNYDPRARIIKQTADAVFTITGRNPKLDIALELEEIALRDEYFIQRKLYPNVDFYSGIIYQALGLPPAIFTVLFAIPRTVGWLAQWQELLADPEQKIARPRQVYIGHGQRDFVPIEERGLTAGVVTS